MGADGDFRADGAARVAGEDSLEFFFSDRGEIVLQNFFPALGSVRERRGSCDLAFGEQAQDLASGGKRARYRLSRLDQRIAQRLPAAEIQRLFLASGRQRGGEEGRRKQDSPAQAAARWVAGFVPKAARSSSRFLRAAAALFALICP